LLRAETQLFVPMIVASEPVGLVFCRGIDVRDVSSTAQLRLLEAFANNAAIALQRLIIGDEARETQHRIDAVRLRNVMLSSMSHDFRTPLASITGAVTTLIDSGASIDQETRTDLMPLDPRGPPTTSKSRSATCWTSRASSPAICRSSATCTRWKKWSDAR
jgi:two-component system sensor histidine kinase KdpD